MAGHGRNLRYERLFAREIAGRGLAVLRDAGVAVDLGLCAEEARWMAAGHILRMTRDRPFVQLKIAVSADGLIAPGDGAPRWVTGPEARQFAHILRARADAILVGRKTVADDNPELTCRLPGLEDRSPRRIILDAKFRTSPTAKMLQTAERVPVTELVIITALLDVPVVVCAATTVRCATTTALVVPVPKEKRFFSASSNCC